MSTDSVRAEAAARSPLWRLLALVPILLLIGAVGIFSATGSSVVDLVGVNPPPADELDIRRVEFRTDEIRVAVRNPQPESVSIASATVDEGIVPFTLDGPGDLGRLRGTTVVIPYPWIEGDPITVGVTTSSGVETVAEIAAAVPTPGVSGRSILGYALIGFLVGVVPVALGMAWLPSLRGVDPRWLAGFMALTAGLLTFLAVDAFGEGLAFAAVLPDAFGGLGLLVIGTAVSYLGLTWVAGRTARKTGVRGAPLSGLALAFMVAIGIGLHNLGEGLAIGSSFAVGELALGSFLIVGFMIQNITEGLGIAAPAAEGQRVRPGSMAALILIAGAPAIVGAWIGGFLTNEVLAVVFFGVAVGAAAQVVTEVGRHLMRRAAGGLTSGFVIGGFLSGLAIMYLTGLLIG